MKKFVIFLILMLFVVSPLNTQEHTGAGKKLDMEGFRKCVKGCYEQFNRCTSEFKSKWINFSDRKIQKAIVNKLKSCCLDGEHDHDATPETSFATCVQRLCEAELWGCKVRKAHQETKTIHEAIRI